MPISNVPTTSLAAAAASIPVSTRNIVLAFLSHGQPIPEDEVKDTLVDADEAIRDLVHDHSTQRISNDRFEYRRPNGNMLISIGTKEGEEITWVELDRVLQGLYRYMTAGIGSEETHYQALEFEIEASGQEKPNIGLGLIWYFNPTESEIQKRVTLPLPISLVSEETLRSPNLTFPQRSNETMRWLSNTTLAMLGANDVQETEIFHIPKTSLSLSVHFFGPPIPERSVQATLQGAMAKIRPFLNGPFEKDPIENDGFRWILPLSREAGIPVAVTVFTYHGHVITYRQLFDILFGLYSFTTTFGTDLPETHYQVLGFRILDHTSRRLGVGTISFFTSETGQLAKRAESVDNERSVWRRRTPNLSLVNPLASVPIVYPVADTDIILSITFLGDSPIPPLEVNNALSGAKHKISYEVAHNPDIAIPGRFRDISYSGRVSTNILEYGTRSITWKQVDQILGGVLQFCQDSQEHNRALVFEIDIGTARRERVGFGTLIYVSPDSLNVEKRGLTSRDTVLRSPNSTIISRPSLTALAVPLSYPVPGTPITLSFYSFGSPIPSIYVNAAFTSALRRIQTHVIHHPNNAIPNGRWAHGSTVTKVWIMLVAYSPHQISWQELSFILVAVLRFMTEAGENHCRELGFFIDRIGEETTGHGSVFNLEDDDRLVEAE